MVKIPIVKIFICGEGGVGKTTLIERLVHGVFNANTIITIGVQHTIYKSTTSQGNSVNLQIWDLGGEERFKVVIPIYVRGSAGGLIVFDESRFATFTNLSEWIELVQRDIDPTTPIILVSTKADLVDGPVISEDQINSLLKKYNLKGYIRTSAKDGLNITDVFEKLIIELEHASAI